MHCETDGGRAALHNQREEVSLGPLLPLSRLSGCLLNNYFTFTLRYALSVCHSQSERDAGCAVISFVQPSGSGIYGWVFLFFFSGQRLIPGESALEIEE